ncbi:retron St85 family RNA-directed DNA polymerase [Tenacibaculum sp. 190524A05c]|uniref:RNA-directed DNA polymerase n=1 Tax=Tenacibaculum platacis TaxID=3137852 RepID=A0ABM9NVM0_9FLAO
MSNIQYEIIDNWKSYINENVRGKITQKAISTYVENLILRDTIVIIDFNHLAQLLGIENHVLGSIISDSKAFYYNFEIPKRNGSQRKISTPYPVLLKAQRWIYENILIKQPLHESSKGFVKETSIVDNAKPHLNQKYILKMDIKDFFPSIKINRVISVFRVLGYTKKISYYLASICCLNGVLPQGAPTSPCLSNIIAKRLDYRLNGLAKKFNLIYTRYADDFTFSGNKISLRTINYINSIASDEGFRINEIKTKLIGEKSQKIITGISISSGKLTIPKKTKREVRKNIHYILKNGLFEHQKHINSNDPIYVERLLGFLFFWLSVEPEKKFIKNSIEKLKLYSKMLDDENTLHNTVYK